MQAIVDAGPLVAFLDRAERHHHWVKERIQELEIPLLTCEPVVTEAMFLLAQHSAAQDALLRLLQVGAIALPFRMEEHVAELSESIRKYRSTPMSLADACLVRMAELYDRHTVLTLDSDFLVYRKHGRAPLLLMHPQSED
jgi:predicted nucleic acid-binding protein